jgi:hypothetical protein
LFWFAAAGQVVPAITEESQKKTLTVVAISVSIWWVKIASKLVRDERYPVCGSADPNNRSSG